MACAVPDRKPGAPRLSGGLRIRLVPGSRAHAIYERDVIDEEYFCNYEVNPEYHTTLEQSDMRITGLGPEGEIRVIELPSRRFYVATLYQPQRSSRPDAPNPLVAAFVEAAGAYHEERTARGAWP